MKFPCRVFDRGLNIGSNASEIIVESTCDVKRTGNCSNTLVFGRSRRMWYSLKLY